LIFCKFSRKCVSEPLENTSISISQALPGIRSSEVRSSNHLFFDLSKLEERLNNLLEKKWWKNPDNGEY
jgi:methionyl-tRNA synthetase